MQENERIKRTIEAVLFACGEPLEIEKLAQVLELEGNAVDEFCNQLQKEYDQDERGFKIVRLNGKVQLCTRPEYFDFVRQILELRRNAPLSQAAFEVLAVIAYNQPVTKSVIEQVRGVDCSGVVSSLCEKGLIEEKGRLELPGRPLLYGTTDSFLRCFSISDLSMLPPLPEQENKAEQEIIEETTNPEETED